MLWPSKYKGTLWRSVGRRTSISFDAVHFYINPHRGLVDTGHHHGSQIQLKMGQEYMVKTNLTFIPVRLNWKHSEKMVFSFIEWELIWNNITQTSIQNECNRMLLSHHISMNDRLQIESSIQWWWIILLHFKFHQTLFCFCLTWSSNKLQHLNAQSHASTQKHTRVCVCVCVHVCIYTQTHTHYIYIYIYRQIEYNLLHSKSIDHLKVMTSLYQ